MINGYWTKTPAEVVDKTADFSADVPSSDSINDPSNLGSLTAVAVYDSENNDVTEVVVDSLTKSGTNLVIRFQDGRDGMNYKVVVNCELMTADTVHSRVYELRVRD